MSNPDLFHCPLNKYTMKTFKLNPLEKFCHHLVFVRVCVPFAAAKLLQWRLQIELFNSFRVTVCSSVSRVRINFFDFWVFLFPVFPHSIVRFGSSSTVRSTFYPLPSGRPLLLPHAVNVSYRFCLSVSPSQSIAFHFYWLRNSTMARDQRPKYSSIRSIFIQLDPISSSTNGQLTVDTVLS